MIDGKPWEEFLDTGLLLYINQILHVFGWVIVYNKLDDNTISVYPARTKYRGFSNESVTDSYTKITKYLSENIEELVEDMNDEIIRRWNSVVTESDTVIHGGDFALCNKEKSKQLIDRLNGRKYLIIGNHDGSKSRMRDVGFVDVFDYWFEDGILICHRPSDVRKDLYEKCDIFLYGHVHSQIIDIPKGKNMCVEVNNFTPFQINPTKEQHGH